MTTQETKSDGPAVLSSALLGRIDELAQWLTDNPNHDDIKDGLTVLVRDVAFAEREACKQAIRDTKDRSGTNYDGQNWLVRAGRSDFIAALDARSNAMYTVKPADYSGD